MKKRNKALALLLACLMSLNLLAGCGGTETPEPAPEPAPEVTEPAPEPAPEPEPEPAEEEFRLVDDEGNAIDVAYRGAIGENGVVTSDRYEASSIGVEILKAGGNAVDAAVATAFAIGVAEPFSNGIGGGGFMTLHLEDGSDIFIDFREYAPAAATDDMFLNADGTVNESTYGNSALGNAVPGTVAGLLYILENYGTMTREEVIRPAVELATNGYVVNPLTKFALEYGFDWMREDAGLAEIYTNDGLPKEMGEMITNPGLAKALEAIIAEGRDGFYKGDVAEAIVASNNAAGGILSMEDLANYDINVLEPVRGTYRGYQVISSPLPSSGGTHLIQILNIMENFDMSQFEHPYTVEHAHFLSEVLKIVYADRAAYMGDPNYVDVPVNGLISKDYAAMLAQKVDMNEVKSYEADDPWKFEGNDTQNLSVADKDGNMVAITMSINDYWGSHVLVDGYGFILNNHMCDFDPIPGGPNSVASGKKPLSSMSPTVVLNEDGSPFMVLGTPGGSTIFAQVAQVISDVIDFGLEIQEAVDLPMIIDDTECAVFYPEYLDPAVVKGLEDMGHVTVNWGNDSFGAVTAIMYEEDGTLHGAAEYHSDGKAVAY